MYREYFICNLPTFPFSVCNSEVSQVNSKRIDRVSDFHAAKNGK